MNASAVVLSLLLIVMVVPSANAADDQSVPAAIDKSAPEAILAGETPGLQIAVYKNGKPLLVQSYGRASIELDVAVRNENVFRIGP